MNSDLPKYIKDRRNQLNITLNELSLRSNLSKGFLSKLENDKQNISRIDNIECLAKGLDVRTYDILIIMKIL